jgi:hypothetical protein
MTNARAYFDPEQQVWWVRVSTPLWREANESKLAPIEPCRVELRDGQLSRHPARTRADHLDRPGHRAADERLTRFLPVATGHARLVRFSHTT